MKNPKDNLYKILPELHIQVCVFRKTGMLLNSDSMIMNIKITLLS
jgi:hypothetical protein